MKKTCNNCKWMLQEDCTHPLTILKCPYGTSPLWEAIDSKKDETIEKAAYAHDKYMLEQNLGNGFAYNVFSFKVGAKWQKEQDSKVMYTEEEVLDLFKSYASDNQFKMNVALLSPEFWFNENKK